MILFLGSSSSNLCPFYPYLSFRFLLVWDLNVFIYSFISIFAWVCFYIVFFQSVGFVCLRNSSFSFTFLCLCTFYSFLFVFYSCLFCLSVFCSLVFLFFCFCCFCFLFFFLLFKFLFLCFLLYEFFTLSCFLLFSSLLFCSFFTLFCLWFFLCLIFCLYHYLFLFVYHEICVSFPLSLVCRFLWVFVSVFLGLCSCFIRVSYFNIIRHFSFDLFP